VIFFSAQDVSIWPYTLDEIYHLIISLDIPVEGRLKNERYYLTIDDV